MKLRAFSLIAFLSLATSGAFAACTSFGTVPTEPDASTVPDASPSGTDATSDGPPIEPRDAGSADVFAPDAAFNCRTVIADQFTAKAPNGNWSLSNAAGAGEGDFSNETASLTLRSGSELYTVLSSPPFLDKTQPPPAIEPDLVVIDFTVAVPTVESMGVTIAQLRALTPAGNIRIAAIPLPFGMAKVGASLLLLSSVGKAAGSIDLEPGEAASLRWAYARIGDEVSVTLERVDTTLGTSPLQSKEKVLMDTSASYFQMGPYSNRGYTTGAKVVYDNVKVQACTKRQ